MTGLDILIYIVLIILIVMIIWYLVWLFASPRRGNQIGGSCSRDQNCEAGLFCDRNGICQKK